MKSMITKNFQGKTIDTFLWNGKTCWIGIQIVKVLGYEKISNPLSKWFESSKSGHLFFCLFLSIIFLFLIIISPYPNLN